MTYKGDRSIQGDILSPRRYCNHRVTVTQTDPLSGKAMSIDLDVLAVDQDHALARVLEWYDYPTWSRGQRAWRNGGKAQ